MLVAGRCYGDGNMWGMLVAAANCGPPPLPLAAADRPALVQARVVRLAAVV